MKNRTQILSSFGQILQQFRKERNLTQEELAEKAGFDRTYISMLERGSRNPSLINVCRLAEALNIKLSKLMEDI